MCEYPYTKHESCGCARIHATLPCEKAFDPSLPKCVRIVVKMTDDGDCPECKPAFDNKSGKKPRITLNLRREPPKTKLNFNSRSAQQEGTFAEIDQQHNQFRGFTRDERETHKAAMFLNWIDKIEDHSPDANPKNNEPAATNPSSRTISPQQRRLVRARRAREACARGKITPSPLPTPPGTITQVLSATCRDEYTLKARHHILTADQREAMRRNGFDNIRRLSVISRRHHHHQQPMGDGSTLITRRHTLSASQRAALCRSGYSDVRRLSVVRRRPSPPLC